MAGKKQTGFLDKLFQLSPNPISVVKVSDATFVDVNNAFTTYFGLKRKEIIGRTPLEVGLISAEERLIYQIKLKKTGYDRSILAKVTSKKKGACYMLFNTKRMKVDGHSYYLSIGTDISTMDFIQKAQQFDNLIQSLDAVKETGVMFIRNYEKKNPSIVYANQEAQNVLKINPLKKILKMIQGQESIFLKTPEFIYYVRNIFCQDGSPWKFIFMRRLIDATCMTQKLKEFNLTSRECQIAVMVTYGHSNGDIAKNLCISQFTVKDHLKSIFKIIGVHKRSELFSKLLSIS